MRRDWSLRPEMLNGSVPPELFARVRDFSPLIDAGECAVRAAIATAPVTLLVMTDRYLHTVSARGTHQWAHGTPRSALTARAEGEDLVVRVADEERRFGSVLPAGAAGHFADELYKAFTVEDARRAQGGGASIADVAW
ncbi:MAG: hypothetical protein QOF33_4717 [Thermomicrobiales bacterium]|nr:hypothetical protein [Thermomicrobiales bacterium]